MKQNKFSKSQLAALGVFLVLMAGIFLLVVKPLINWRSNINTQIEHSLQERQKLKQRLQTLSTEISLLPKNENNGIFWSGEKPGEASAQIQSAINVLTRQTAVSLKSVTPLPAAAFAQDGVLGARIEIEATLDHFLEFILKLETHEPPLVIERSNIRRLVRPSQRQEQPLILAQLDIAAVFNLGGVDK